MKTLAFMLNPAYVTFVDVLAVGRSSTVEILNLRYANKEALF
jgi:hypothetical protein